MTLAEMWGVIASSAAAFGTILASVVALYLARQSSRVSASWANLVERFFATLTDKQIRRGVFTSVPHLEKRLREYLKRYNENPQPLVWTKSLGEIMVKVERGRAALVDNSYSPFC